MCISFTITRKKGKEHNYSLYTYSTKLVSMPIVDISQLGGNVHEEHLRKLRIQFSAWL